MKLCDLQDLEETGAYGVEFNGDTYVVVLSPEDGQPRVYKNRCPHLGIELEMRPHHFLDMGREFIVCANHGALFQMDDGLCVAGPCKNQWLTALPATLKNGEIWLDTTAA